MASGISSLVSELERERGRGGENGDIGRSGGALGGCENVRFASAAVRPRDQNQACLCLNDNRSPSRR